MTNPRLPIPKKFPSHWRHLLLPDSEHIHDFDPSRTFDKKISGLQNILHSFGRRSVAAVMLGLSRPFSATSEDIASLIDQFERRDPQCCYQGTMDDLFATRDTMVFAISYRHANMDDFGRKGPGRTCKLTPRDEALFTAAITGLNATYPKVVVWCDQILSTRLEDEDTCFEWYHIGLLPFMTFQVLNLSTHMPDEELEKRIWIRAERSLARMGNGCRSANDAAMKIPSYHLGESKSGAACLRNLCKHILSGYWPKPPDQDFWAADYYSMKQWALGVLCRGNVKMLDNQFFEHHSRIDNIEILSNVGELATIPEHMEEAEPVMETEDKEFFLKATAWNLSLRNDWEEDTCYISHYMGSLGDLEDVQFSWWQCKEVNVLFGCLKYSVNGATRILAVETRTGYQVFRSTGNWDLYKHAERIAGPQTQAQILQAATKAGIQLYPDMEWHLLYCSGNDSLNSWTADEIRRTLKVKASTSSIMVPSVYRGMTTSLFKSAVATLGQDPATVARTISKCVEEWNEYVKRTYTTWERVKDTTVGPIWLEGFDGDRVTFGFLEFLTNALILNKSCIPRKTVKVSETWDVENEIKTMRRDLKSNELCLADEFVKDIDLSNANNNITGGDVVRFILSGGFTNDFGRRGLLSFLKETALAKGYWVTNIVSWGGEMQIRFISATGECRIAQRKTMLPNYSALGVVDPRDSEGVKLISVPHVTSGDDHLMMTYWKYKMDDTTTREAMWSVLKNSIRTYKKTKVLLTDMTTGLVEDSCLTGSEDLNIFFYGINPFHVMKLARTGEAAEMFEKEKKKLRIYNARYQDKFSKESDRFDQRRNFERKMREEGAEEPEPEPEPEQDQGQTQGSEQNPARDSPT